MLLGAIEAGGTKFVCAVSNERFEIMDRKSIPTTTPGETLNQVFEFFKPYRLASLGVGSFGPVDLNPQSPTYGYITSTPKMSWQNFDLLGTLENTLEIPISLTTDVNAASLAELELGAAVGYESCLYLTVGTGIGGGFSQKGKTKCKSHPEMGHIRIKRHLEDSFEGLCPFHHDCLEGLASGPAIEKRCGIPAYELDKDDRAWEFVAHYLAQGILNSILTLMPDKIVLGGGVSQQRHLLPLIEKELHQLNGGYVPLSEIKNPSLGHNSGVMGSLILAAKALDLVNRNTTEAKIT